MAAREKYTGVKPITSPATLAETNSSLNLLRKNLKTFPVFSQICLPGGPKSATYDPDTYVYPSSYDVTDGIQPSILAIEGDTQVGVSHYLSGSTDDNHNRSSKPFHHTITEKAFYTELDNSGDIRETLPQKTFLRVDLTEGNKVFRHNAVIVKGSIHCTNQRLYSLNDEKPDPSKVFGLYDFEYYFVCNPLTSHTTGLDYTNSEGRLSTLGTCYFYLRNRADNVNGVLDQSLEDITFIPPLLDGQVNPQHNWAEFALKSETGTPSGHINLTPQILRQYTNGDIDIVTPVSAGLTEDVNDLFDLNFVNFKLVLPTFQTPILDAEFKRFAVKGTYLLI
jgi:hypothetical protein